MGELALGSILTMAFCEENAQEVVVGYRCLRVLPVVSIVLLHVVDVQWVGELFQVFLGGSFSSVVVGPRARHVRMWLGVVLFLGVKRRWVRDVIKWVALLVVI